MVADLKQFTCSKIYSNGYSKEKPFVLWYKILYPIFHYEGLPKVFKIFSGFLNFF